MPEKIEKCPCEDAPSIWHDVTFMAVGIGWQVSCTCGVSGPRRDSVQDAIADWNRIARAARKGK